jgi:hypothetical protein
VPPLAPWSLDDLPENMKRLPVHLKMGLPVPVINTFGFQEYDFTSINGELSTGLAQRHLCGLCSEKMEDEVAFLGGPQSADTRAYTDPPMHPACAEAAVQLCPHINRRNMKRAPEHRLREGALSPEQMTLVKPGVWVMLVVAVDDYRITLVNPKSPERFIMYVPGTEVRRREWTYNDEGRIIPVNIETGEVDA